METDYVISETGTKIFCKIQINVVFKKIINRLVCVFVVTVSELLVVQD